MFKGLISLYLIFLTSSSLASELQNPTIHWAIFDWPPYMYTKDKVGPFNQLVELYEDNIKNYQHKRLPMNWSQFYDFAKDKFHACNLMAIKREDRLKYMYFSKPISIGFPIKVIINKSKLKYLEKPLQKKISIHSLITNKGLKSIIESTRSYTPQIDKLITLKDQNYNFKRKPIRSKQLLEMLQRGRIDYVIEYSGIVRHHLGSNYLEKFQAIELVETPLYVFGHAGCPKDEWGKKVISEINAVTKKHALSGKLYKLLESYTGLEEIPKLKKIFHENLLKHYR